MVEWVLLDLELKMHRIYSQTFLKLQIFPRSQRKFFTVWFDIKNNLQKFPMSFFLDSDDFKTGPGASSSNGTWTFNRSCKGNWNVIAQQMETQNYPWMNANNNVMVMRIHNPMDLLEVVVFEITFPTSIGLLSDITQIAIQMAAAIQSAIDAIAVPPHEYAARLVDQTSDNEEIVFIFSDDPVDVLWQGFELFEGGANFESTCNVPLGRTAASADENTIDTLTMSTATTATMIIDPKYLEVYIEESNTQFATSHGTKPNLFFSTRDGEFTGQNITIPKDTNTLTIEIRRAGDSLPLPLSGKWYLAFQNTA